MEPVWVSSKFVTETYYGHPVDHVTLTMFAAPGLSEAEIEACKENARRQLESYPVERFPVAGTFSLLDRYFERHPEFKPQTQK